MKQRLDQYLAEHKIVSTRSQAESYIRMGRVTVNGTIVTKPGHFVSEGSEVKLNIETQYVSRAALKLASVTDAMGLDFKGKLVLDVGSSTGGFTDFALKNGAAKVIAVDVGTDQLHPSLRENASIELHEKTDIRDFKTDQDIDIVVIDVSFISLGQILPGLAKIISRNTQIVAMLKPQFEAQRSQLNKGVVKNSTLRREIIKNFENWLTQNKFLIIKKADSSVAGEKGNLERFYLLKKSK